MHQLIFFSISQEDMEKTGNFVASRGKKKKNSNSPFSVAKYCKLPWIYWHIFTFVFFKCENIALHFETRSVFNKCSSVSLHYYINFMIRKFWLRSGKIQGEGQGIVFHFVRGIAGVPFTYAGSCMSFERNGNITSCPSGNIGHLRQARVECSNIAEIVFLWSNICMTLIWGDWRVIIPVSLYQKFVPVAYPLQFAFVLSLILLRIRLSRRSFCLCSFISLHFISLCIFAAM